MYKVHVPNIYINKHTDEDSELLNTRASTVVTSNNNKRTIRIIISPSNRVSTRIDCNRTKYIVRITTTTTTRTTTTNNMKTTSMVHGSLVVMMMILLATTTTTTLAQETNNVVEESTPTLPTLWELVTSNRDYLTLETAMILADVVVLSDTSTTVTSNGTSTNNSYTLLAPDNDAFAMVPGKYLGVQWTSYLRAMMEYHILPGTIMVDAFILHEKKNQTSLAMPTLFVGKNMMLTEDDPITFDDVSMIVDGNYEASNGVLHKVNTVLQVPTMRFSLMEQISQRDDTTIFYNFLLQAKSLYQQQRRPEGKHALTFFDDPGPWTLFVPTNEAFAKYNTEALFRSIERLVSTMLNHVTQHVVLAYQQQHYNTVVTTMANDAIMVSSSGIVDQHASFVEADILASDGVWHLMNDLLWPDHMIGMVNVPAEDEDDDITAVPTMSPTTLPAPR